MNGFFRTKKIISLLITFAVLLGIGTSVFADDAPFDLQAAINSAGSGDTIKLQGDVIKGVTIDEGKEITIDLDGYSILTTDYIAIQNYGVLTVKGSGTVMGGQIALYNWDEGEAHLLGGVFTNSGKGTDNYPVVNCDSILTIEGATVTGNSSGSGAYSIFNAGDLTVNKGSLIQSYGVVSNQDRSGSNIVNTESGVVTINGGFFTAFRYNIYSALRAYDTCGRVVINGGEFYLPSSDAIASFFFHSYYDYCSDGSFTVNGGYFNSSRDLFAANQKTGLPILVKGGYFYPHACFAHNISEIRVEGATLRCGYPGLIDDTCNDIYFIDVVSEEEIDMDYFPTGGTLTGSVIKAEDPSGERKWYIGTAASRKVRNAAKGTKISLVYGVLSASISHDIYMTVPWETLAYIDGKQIPSDGANHVVHKDIALTSLHPCLSPDSPSLYYCSDCGKYYKDEEGTIEVPDVSALDFVYSHDPEYIPLKPATSMEEGYEAHYKCRKCGELFADSACKQAMDSPVVIPKLPFWNEPTYEWASDYSTVTATHVCKDDPALIETETVATNSRIVKYATTTEPGIRMYYSDAFENSSFAVQTKDVEIPVLIPSVSAKPSSSPTAEPSPTTAAAPSPTTTAAPSPTTVAVPSPTNVAAPSPARVKPTTTPALASEVSLTLDKDSEKLKCDKSFSLTATLKGSTSKVIWKSSDSKIAAVDANGKVTAKQAGTVTITASAAGKSATCVVTVLYKDVANTKDFWFAPTNYLTAANVVKGYDKQTKFKPANDCTRAQMVTFLWRLAGEPAPKSDKTAFKDIKSSDYFYKPVLWAVEKGITTGVSKTKFNPKGVCTRAQTVTFLWRMAGKPAPKTTKNKFSDVKSKDYFYKAVLWASEKKIVAGYSDGTFKPQGKCLRRQMVTFLYKYDKYAG